MSINNFIEEAHFYSKNNGFWDKEINIGEKLMLIVSELGEALEAHRKNKRCPENLVNCEFDKQNFEDEIKDTFEDELADVCIRLFDLAGGLNIDLENNIKLKMQYNKTRPYKHNKAY